MHIFFSITSQAFLWASFDILRFARTKLSRSDDRLIMFNMALVIKRFLEELHAVFATFYMHTKKIHSHI